ncbi:MAG: DEAD/DEAH box helicase, partial [Planctomycetota bacterium]
LSEGLLWPEPLIQLNPSFAPGETIDELVDRGILHEACRWIFRKDKDATSGLGRPLRLHRHQADAIEIARTGANYVLTTGTGSGKSLAYIIPIVDHILRTGSGRGIQAIVIYPMNALANSQVGELEKFLGHGSPDGKRPVSFARYTGQEKKDEKARLQAEPPDILLTNYVMLELILTRPEELPFVRSARGLRFLVLDELHTYRGRQGADVAMLVRRARDAFEARHVQCVGTSATLAGHGTWEEQRAEVARIASLLFGAPVSPEHVIGETLRRATPDRPLDDQVFIDELRDRIQDPRGRPASDYEAFVQDPLSIWIESTLGVAADPESGRLVRVPPKSIAGPEGGARLLSAATGIPEGRCEEAIREQLLASYRCAPDPATGFPVFAFRLHQFLSRGDKVYASLEPEADRHITLHGQTFVPGSNRDRILLPLVFCRQCGQEYYCVFAQKDENGRRRFAPRELDDHGDDGDETESGFIYLSGSDPWPEDAVAIAERIPEDWIEDAPGGPRIRRDNRSDLPVPVRIGPDGSEADGGVSCHFIPAKFRFCLRCGIAYVGGKGSDFARLATLATEGRSSATTILSLAAIRYLRGAGDLPEDARKLLSFTDNRQDASLQAGHFNDFLEVGLLRSAIYRAVKAAGSAGLEHDLISQRVFEALNLPLDLYASDPQVQFQALEDTNRALRDVLGYRIYRDLERGWRITVPNLEQCGLLAIRYKSLDDLCREDGIWKERHPALANASPETRAAVVKTLLDHMRRELAIKVDFLDSTRQDQIRLRSSQRLLAPWAIDENEGMETSRILFPRPKRPGDREGIVCLSGRGGFGRYLRRRSTFPDFPGRISREDSDAIIRDLLEAVRRAGLVERVEEPRDEDDVPGYKLVADAMIWLAGDGRTAPHDPIRVPRAPEAGCRTNPFFVQFYTSIATEGLGLEAREHTAQVKDEERIDREERFREGRLPVLFCSPTMELGIDIKDLNVVNMRNIPPTPANYAQRSGRAGRNGQPALVFSYCSTFSSHDQYFFHRPERMVAGAVSPPRLELANEDLIRAHVHAVWLANPPIPLGSSLRDILDLSGEDPKLELLDSIRNDIADPKRRGRARARAARILDGIREELDGADWYGPTWLEEVFVQVAERFDRACDRWRDLYRSAHRQQARQSGIMRDASRSDDERKRAKRLFEEAQSQLELLLETDRPSEADFYIYRYLASEGFLPGYNFPRLPLSAYIPGRRDRTRRSEFLSRPRFLAISEFGPRAVVYHEGARYRINRVILPSRGDAEDIVTASAKLCESCGYLHPVTDGAGPDLCERCGRALGAPLGPLFRLQNVSTRRLDRINSDEEERLRLGYEVRTAVRFADAGSGLSCRGVRLPGRGCELADILYGARSTLWRINLGWKRRADPRRLGFFLDIERGYWARDEREPEEDGDPLSPRTRRVIPFVEDRRNVLILTPRGIPRGLEKKALASLAWALKAAIQVEFQLEENELAAELLPSGDTPRHILFYEAAEGGAGVLRQLVEDSGAIPRVARAALEICHFDPDTGEDRRRGPRAREDCEAACYDCLMSYQNQLFHPFLDRHAIEETLLAYRSAAAESSPAPVPRPEHLAKLRRLCASKLEEEWLGFLEARSLRLPSRAQVSIEGCRTRPDFVYEGELAAIYIDGPHHEFPDRRERDRAQTELMEDRGYTVIRFGAKDDWSAIIERYPSIFGRPS